MTDHMGIIKGKVAQLRAENVQNLNMGDRRAYQFNCAKLEGINYVLEVFSR